MNHIPLEENESQIALNEIFRAKLKLNDIKEQQGLCYIISKSKLI
jgi:hypothetical protein